MDLGIPRWSPKGWFWDPTWIRLGFRSHSGVPGVFFRDSWGILSGLQRDCSGAPSRPRAEPSSTPFWGPTEPPQVPKTSFAAIIFWSRRETKPFLDVYIHRPTLLNTTSWCNAESNRNPEETWAIRNSSCAKFRFDFEKDLAKKLFEKEIYSASGVWQKYIEVPRASLEVWSRIPYLSPSILLNRVGSIVECRGNLTKTKTHLKKGVIPFLNELETNLN